MLKRCPKCRSHLSVLTTILLTRSLDVDPVQCGGCGARLVNTWLGHLIAPILFVAIVVLIEIRYDTTLFDLQSISSIALLLFGIMLVRYLFTTPVVYDARKGWCPYCERKDAPFAWSSDEVRCLDCEFALVPDEEFSKNDE